MRSAMFTCSTSPLWHKLQHAHLPYSRKCSGLTTTVASTTSWKRGILRGTVQGGSHRGLDTQSTSSGLRRPLALHLHAIVREVAETAPDAASAGVSLGEGARPAGA